MRCKINEETGMLTINPDNETEIRELKKWEIENNSMFANYGIEVDYTLNEQTAKDNTNDNNCVVPVLRCKWNGAKHDNYNITIGKTYSIVKEYEYYYSIINDLGEVKEYNKSCFELINN